MPLDLTERDGACVFDVLVSPRASRSRIGPVADGRLRVAVTAPPVAGEANDALCRLLAQALALPRRAVSVVHGAASRRKTVRVEGCTAADVHRLLPPRRR